MFPRMVKKLIASIRQHFREGPQQESPETGWVEVIGMGFRWRLCMDHYLDRSFIKSFEWEPHAMKLVASLVKPRMCVLDVGANFGIYSLVLSRLVGDSGTVIAFEPTQEYLSRLKWHLQQNNISNVRVEALGLSDREETTGISIGNSSATLYWVAEDAPRLIETVHLVPLDDWWDHYVAQGNTDRLDFIKVDTDGHEPMVLKGAERTLRRHRPTLLIEFVQENLVVNGHTAWGLANQLEELGYVLCSEKDGLPYQSRRLLLKEAGNFAWSANVLARPR